jgi:putative DNA primase/helicase
MMSDHDQETPDVTDDEIPNGGPAANVPAELRALPQWVGWRKVVRDGRPTKVPVDPKTGGAGDSTAPGTWGTFDRALAGARLGRWDGVGFVFTAADPYVGIDWDDVIDPATGAIDPDAAAEVEGFGSYAEVTPSGAGVHVIIRGRIDRPGRKRGDRECYDSGRFFTVTGVVCSPHGVEDRQAAFDGWHRRVFPDPAQKPAAPREPAAPLDMTDAQLIDAIRASKQGEKFDRLWAGDQAGYASGSEADLALAAVLVWWCQGDTGRADRLFRASGLMRPKWDASRGDQTYGARTLAKAAEGTDGGYTPAAAPAPPGHPAGLPAVERFTHEELMGREFPPQRWLVDGLVADESLTILGGVQKAGKSWLSIQLAQAVGGGADFLGRAVQPGRVVYLALEDGARRLKDRLQKQNSPSRLPIEWYTRFPKLDGPEGVKLFTDIAATRPRLIVVDTLAAAKTGRTDEQSSGPMADLFNMLREFAQRYGVAILVVHHHGKTVTGDPAHDLRGSSAIGAAADVLLGLYRVRRNAAGEVAAAEDGMPDPEEEIKPDFYIKARGRDIEDSTTAVTFDIGKSWLWRAADRGTHDKRVTDKCDRADAILSAFATLGRATVARVAEVVKVSDDTVSRRVNEFVADNRLREVPPDGTVTVGKSRPPKVYEVVRVGG